MVSAREDIDFINILFAMTGGAVVGLAILYSTLLGNVFQSLMSVLPTSIILLLFQFRKNPSQSAKMMGEIARNELALATSMVTLVIFLAAGIKMSWFTQSLFVVALYAVCFFTYRLIM